MYIPILYNIHVGLYMYMYMYMYVSAVLICWYVVRTLADEMFLWLMRDERSTTSIATMVAFGGLVLCAS